MTQCTRCVMDTTDPDITFNEEGVCDHCQRYDRQHIYWQHEAQRLPDVITALKLNGEDRPYDCLMGISGGVDSSYMLYMAVHTFGLRPYVFNIDNGWNTDAAATNMTVICDALHVQLHQITLDSALVYDIQRAFLRSGVADVDIASDHIIRAIYYDLAYRLDLDYALMGVNYRTETHGVRAWSQGHADWAYIRTIHQRYGTLPTDIPHYSTWQLITYKLRDTPIWIPLLNYLDYHPSDALATLQAFCDYRTYHGKHGENVFTKWFQGYYLPTRFGYDKRKCHLSNLICSGELTRADALHQLTQPPYDRDQMAQDTQIVLNRLHIAPDEWQQILTQPIVTYDEVPHSRLLTLLVKAKQTVKGMR